MTSSSLPFASCSALAFALCAAPAAAQTPFADGELLLRGPSGLLEALYRVDPQTGHATLVADGLSPSTGGGTLAYDSFRELALVYGVYPPLGPSTQRLYGFASDGAIVEIGFDVDKITGMAPTGDGRVYCFRLGALHVIDAGDNLVPVLDAGGQPVTTTVSHLWYDAASNVLIGAGKSTGCGTSLMSIVRYPLDATGHKLAGPVVCNPIPLTTSTASFAVGLDPLPGGDLLLTMAGTAGPGHPLLQVDVATLTATVFSDTTLFDNDGGVWCPTIARAVVLNDSANELRTFTAGQGGGGTVLSVDVPVSPASGGLSDTNKLADVEVLGPPCAGVTQTFGQGLAGKGGVVPTLTSSTCPTLGLPLKLHLRDGVGQGLGFAAIAGTTAPYPLFGGTGYLVPPLFVQLALPLGGLSGIAGAGKATVAIPTPADPSLLGVPFYGQGGVLDAAAPFGVALTAALELQLH